MEHYVVEIAVWMLLLFFAGCAVGAMLRSTFGAAEPAMVPAGSPVSPQPAAEILAAAPAMAASAETLPPEISSPLPMAAVPGAARPERPIGLAAPSDGKPDDLQHIVGIGPKYEKVLHALGFFHFGQIAAWTPQEVAWVDEHLMFNGRIEREEWVVQARLLANGAVDEFERRFGHGSHRPPAS